MPIEFVSIESENYFISKWTGTLTDSEMIESYKEFYEGPHWKPGMSELADVSEADFKLITSKGLSRLAKNVEALHEKHGVMMSKSAAYSPTSLQFGMARTYEAWSSESPELVRVFTDIEEARHWLLQDESE